MSVYRDGRASFPRRSGGLPLAPGNLPDPHQSRRNAGLYNPAMVRYKSKLISALGRVEPLNGSTGVSGKIWATQAGGQPGLRGNAATEGSSAGQGIVLQGAEASQGWETVKPQTGH